MHCSQFGNKFDFFIVLTIASSAWGSYELLGAFTPIRIIGLVGLLVALKNIEILKSAAYGISVLFVIWIIYSLLSVMWSLSFSSWLIQFCHTSTLMGAVMAMAIWGTKARQPKRSVLRGWLLFVSITMPIAIWELSTGNHLSSGSFNENTITTYGLIKNYAAVTFVNYNSYVVLLCMALPFIIMSIVKERKGRKIIALFVLIFILVVLAYNTSRGGIICFIIALLLWVTTKFSQLNFSKKVLFVGLLGIVIFYFISYIEEIKLFEALLRRSESTELFEDNSRIDVWMRSISVSARYCFLGSGCGSMPRVLDHFYNGQLSYCHNYVIETLLEYGLLISTIWFMLIFKVVVRCIKSKEYDIRYIGLYVLFSAPFLMIIDDYYAQRNGIWLYISSIIVLSNLKVKEVKGNRM